MLSSAKSNQLVWHSSAVFPFSTYMTKAFSVSLQLCTTYRRKSGKARASVSYARLTSFPHTKRGLFLHSLVLRLLRLHQCTREEFNSFCARVEEGWPPRNCLDNCLLCKWKQQSHYSTFCKSHLLQKSRTTKCKSGLGLLCSRPDLTLLPWKDYSEMKHFSDSRLLSFLCDVRTMFKIAKKISLYNIASEAS